MKRGELIERGKEDGGERDKEGGADRKRKGGWR